MANGDFNNFPQLANALHSAAKQVVKKVAFDIQAAAQGDAPVDTGFLRGSIYVVTSSGASGYTPGAEAFPKLDKSDDETTAYVAVGALYGIYVELGTRFMVAKPYFFSALDRGQESLDAAIAAIADRLDEITG